MRAARTTTASQKMVSTIKIDMRMKPANETIAPCSSILVTAAPGDGKEDGLDEAGITVFGRAPVVADEAGGEDAVLGSVGGDGVIGGEGEKPEADGWAHAPIDELAVTLAEDGMVVDVREACS